jgi:peptidoglycan/xylan/chitin deacetylase (PgdA/CDA1 family)
LLTERGYLYTSDFHNDDMPYILENDGQMMVQIPAGMDDWELNLMNVHDAVGMGSAQPYSSPAAVTDTLISWFNMLYEESAHEPRVMQYCMHPSITGRPHRAWGLEQVIKHMKAHSGVWFCSMETVASLCR